MCLSEHVISHQPAREIAYANRAATIAKKPAPAKVSSELAPPVVAAVALVEVPEEVWEADELDVEEPEVLEPEVLELALPVDVDVEVPVDVIVLRDPLEDNVEVMVDAATGGLEGMQEPREQCQHT